MRILKALLPLLVLMLPSLAGAQTIPLVTSSPMANGNTEYALGIQILMVSYSITIQAMEVLPTQHALQERTVARVITCQDIREAERG